MSLHVLAPGPLALVQDLGRPGLAHLGVSPSGALDRGALALANRLVGNAEGAAGVEVLLGGFEARVDAPLWFAVTGAEAPLTLDGRPLDPNLPHRAEAGQLLRLGGATAGLRLYLALRGGVAVPPVLGSRSRDVLASLGPAPLAAGDVLPAGDLAAHPVPAIDVVPVERPAAGAVEVHASRGPRADWFTPDALDAFYGTAWRIGADSNRVGARLDPPAAAPVSLLERRLHAELPSEPMVAGSVQVSPDGRPTVLLADHPVTGGYPVIAVVTAASLDRFAQLRPGQEVAFRHA
ncbi:biotin-dependent carboxyltransferase family protein [Leifsonia sp. F6_8S_P_1B]|uniref:Biotin-dependent carboxyltransferase family protein n=1 Tax=Leifsonia williamsii TaxID=3035919 RepID=A0ABT8KFN6_9MICO|nr:biotin-dependent carboxyltransferase family protein [Leifsonia williamsii]MDN4616255.1 biotin-dependent carboxyltransferase family protein [Leifsonia williamsii]